jgi:hypothetical protein
MQDTMSAAPLFISELRCQDPRTRAYLGSPSLVRLASGALLASHEFFGPGSPLDRYGEEFLTMVYRSEDDGASWRSILPVAGAFWSSLFRLGDAVYMIGTSAHDGDIVIRRSTDGGYTWTRPHSPSTGLLFTGGPGRQPPNHHCAPVPVLLHGGRVWRGFEDNDETVPFAGGFRACVISAPQEADLLDAGSWTMSDKLRYDQGTDPRDFGLGSASGAGGVASDASTDAGAAPVAGADFTEFSGGMPGWLEGNVVAGPDGTVWDMLRVHAFPALNKAALVRVEGDGRRLSFDPGPGFIDFPGGGAKFTVRRDGETGLYWSLVNDMRRGERPVFRNRLTAVRSADLRSWERVCVLMEDDPERDPWESVRRTGFQYVDWQFDGPDILFLVRAACDGAPNWHDANRIIFGRLPGFRDIEKEKT